MPFEQLLTKVIKRRKPDRGKSDGKGIDGKDAKKAESSSSEDEGESQKDWVVVRDPHGRLAWQHRKTGEVTYGNSYASHQAGYNPALAQEAFGKGGSDSESDSEKKANKPKPPPPPPVPVMAPVYPPGGMPFVPPPVGFMPSPATYGPSPVAMYPVAPWNAMPVSPVPMHVPEYIKRQHAEAEKKRKEEEAKKKKKEEAERQKKIAEGTWERYYTDDGGVFYQHTVTGQKLSEDPYR